MSDIEWTDTTWNPTRGCSRASTGCERCYAELIAHRFSGPGKPYDGLTRMTSRGPTWTGEVRLIHHKLDEPLHWRKPRRVFVNSMSDTFHEAVTDAEIARVFEAMQAAPQHQYQVLTKRAERMRDWCSTHARLLGQHVWMGVSAENQDAADERIPHLAQVEGAGVRFLSCEPLLGPLDLSPWLHRIDWLIAGGESGPGARRCDLSWIEDLLPQCRAAGVAPFVKQKGAVLARENGWHSHKGGDPAEWPETCRVREWPDAA